MLDLVLATHVSNAEERACQICKAGFPLSSCVLHPETSSTPSSTSLYTTSQAPSFDMPLICPMPPKCSQLAMHKQLCDCGRNNSARRPDVRGTDLEGKNGQDEGIPGVVS